MAGSSITTEQRELLQNSWCGTENGQVRINIFFFNIAIRFITSYFILYFINLKHKVCCPAPTRATQRPTSRPTPSPTPSARLTDYSYHRNAYLLETDLCGNDNSNKIANGNKTEPFEYPWMAIIQYRNRKFNNFEI